MTIKKLWSELVRRLNLTRSEGNSYAFGLIHGVPVKIMYRLGWEKNLLEFTLFYNKPELADSLQQRIDRLAYEEGSKLRLDSEVHAEGRYTYTIAGSLFVNPSIQTLVKRFRALVDLINTFFPAPVVCCSRCNEKETTVPLLVNGVLCRLCAPCQLVVKEEHRLEKEQYEQKVIKPVPVVLTGLGLMLASALGWAILSEVTGYMFKLVAVAIGYGISAVLLQVAGRGSRLVQGVGIASVLLAVLLGNVFFIGYEVWKELSAAGIPLDLTMLMDSVRLALADDLVNTLYSLLFGLFGAHKLVQTTGTLSHELTMERV